MAEKLLKILGLDSWAQLWASLAVLPVMFFLAQMRWEKLGHIFLAVIGFLGD